MESVKKRMGQTTLEYSAILILIMAAILTIGVYFKRGVQGRWKAAVDDMGDQYDPWLTNSDVLHRVTGNSETSISTVEDGNEGGFWTMRRDETTAVENRTGHLKVGAP